MEGARFFNVLRIERVKHLWHRRIVNMCDIIVHYVYTCGASAHRGNKHAQTGQVFVGRVGKVNLNRLFSFLLYIYPPCIIIYKYIFNRDSN